MRKKRLLLIGIVFITSICLLACGLTNQINLEENKNTEEITIIKEEITTSDEELTELKEIISEKQIEVKNNNMKEKQYLIAIDAGHQAKGNNEKEPIGPEASEMKIKVASGTSGCVSGLDEYELTLEISLKLQEELEKRGYNVLMIRTSHDVNISNAERASLANEAKADVFIRVHANGSEDSSINGAMTICQTKNNPYNRELYEKSKKLSTSVLEQLTASTGCKKQYVWETDTMSGINWCQVPVTIVEVGYMTNPKEDALLAKKEYQLKIAEGIANGIDDYLLNEKK